MLIEYNGGGGGGPKIISRFFQPIHILVKKKELAVSVNVKLRSNSVVYIKSIYQQRFLILVFAHNHYMGGRS